MHILGIESSCDETAAAVVADGRQVLSNVVASQIPFHRKYGGVVPEIASRQHVTAFLPVIDGALKEAGIDWSMIGGIAVTTSPGLIGSLVIGVTAAKTLAYVHDKPILAVDHLAAHMYANCLAGMAYEQPHLALLVSGGHTALFHNQGNGCVQRLGSTVDDAVGEAFDKVAKLLGIGYPGGPAIQRLAMEGDPHSVPLPLPMRHSGDLNFSYSGLKTAVRQRLEQDPGLAPKDLAASFQHAAVSILVIKTMHALEQTGCTVVALSGGVAANALLRERLREAVAARGADFFVPPMELCTDNAAMTAGLGYQLLVRGCLSDMTINASSN
ncbi:tRNA (adenosine(37)-N6)-threonylcarbamoyltransferase complex transferase subunit TsaD [bacterium]|nr:tRNA (adenosine(37)-N6)-threonylcarbamoyltransferase complex transferase subunit TsaD [candidate division CSSED10-310 bacterium]